VQKVPQARTPSLEVMLLQADYHRAEGLIGKWLDTPSDTKTRDEAAEILGRIAPQLEQRQKELQVSADRLSEQVDKMNAGDERDVKENELSRLRSIAGRAAYFAAWSNYYLVRAQPRRPAGQGCHRQGEKPLPELARHRQRLSRYAARIFGFGVHLAIPGGDRSRVNGGCGRQPGQQPCVL